MLKQYLKAAFLNFNKCSPPTCLHFAIESSRSIQDQALDLQELVWLVASNNSETEPPTTLFQLGINESPFQLGSVPSKERLPS